MNSTLLAAAHKHSLVGGPIAMLTAIGLVDIVGGSYFCKEISTQDDFDAGYNLDHGSFDIGRAY